jgi:chemotaxis protein methyltransferase CheR
MFERPSCGAGAIVDLTSFDAVRDLIEARCGLRFDDSQRGLLADAVSCRMQQLGLDREDTYLDRLRGEAPRIVETELRQLLNLVTVTETCFFRDASHFRLLRDRIVPALADRPVLRLWSAGCSSGEEAYSIALTLSEMGLYRNGRVVEIVGTDLNSAAMERARQGTYSARAVRHVEGWLLDRYFIREGDVFTLVDDVKRRVKFEFGNLMQTPMPPTGPQDVIFCKNVAIYFRPEMALKLIAGLRDTLTPGGYLLLGHAEALWQLPQDFELIEHERAFGYRKIPHGTSPRNIDLFVRQKSQVTAAPAEVAVPTDVEQAEDDRLSQYDACLSAHRAGDWTRAEVLLRALIGSHPTFVPAQLLLGGLCANRGRFAEAAEQAQTVLRLNDLEARAHLLLGMVAARQHRTDDAIQSLRRALYLDDSLALAHFWLGNVYRDRGEVARACLEYTNVARGWARRTLDFTEEFAPELTPEQLVGFCTDSLQRLEETAHG